jgi:osmoprotectant transport system substrate-binding protein
MRMKLRRSNRILTGGTALVLASTLALAGCGDDGDDNAAAEAKGQATVATAGFTEIDLMAEMYELVLENEGWDIETKQAGQRELYAPLLLDGSVDVVPDYLGAITNYLHSLEVDDPNATIATGDVDATVTELRRLAEAQGLTALDPAEASNQDAFAVTRDYAEENDLTSLSDLGESGLSVVAAATEECPTRTVCGVLLTEDYGIDVTKWVPFPFDSTTSKKQVQDGKAQLTVVGTTTADLDDFGLILLEEDKGLVPAQNLIPILGKDSPLATDDDALDALGALNAALTTEDLKALIRRVDTDREELDAVAADYLQSKDLLG